MGDALDALAPRVTYHAVVRYMQRVHQPSIMVPRDGRNQEDWALVSCRRAKLTIEQVRELILAPDVVAAITATIFPSWVETGRFRAYLQPQAEAGGAVVTTVCPLHWPVGRAQARSSSNMSAAVAP